MDHRILLLIPQSGFYFISLLCTCPLQNTSDLLPIPGSDFTLHVNDSQTHPELFCDFHTHTLYLAWFLPGFLSISENHNQCAQSQHLSHLFFLFLCLQMEAPSHRVVHNRILLSPQSLLSLMLASYCCCNKLT
jgi:hypothetical protein